MSATDPLCCVPVRDIHERTGVLVQEVRSFLTILQKLEHLASLARTSSVRWDVSALAHEIVGGRVDYAAIEALHAWVRDNIRYAREPIEMLEAPAFVMRDRFGDCDAQGSLLVSLAMAAGYSSALVAMGGEPLDPMHLAAALDPVHRGRHARITVIPWVPFGSRAPAGMRWAECTVRAELGEEPYAASRRTGADLRPDLGR